jgi:hypothetical protein
MRSRFAIAFAIGLGLFVGGLSCAYQQAPFLDYAPTRGVDLPAPPPDKAQVIFFLRISNAPGETLALYHEGERFGLLRYVTWTSRLVEPGHHRFGLVSPENADFTVGTLQGGRTYLLEAQQIFPTYRYRLEPVGPAETHTGMSIAESLAAQFHVEPNAGLASWVQQHGARYQQTYDRYLAKWLTKPADERRTITPDLAIAGPVRYQQTP